MAIKEIDYGLRVPEPELYLARPDKSIIGKINKHAYNIDLITKLRDIGQLTFTLPVKIDIGGTLTSNPFIDKLKQNFLIRCDYNGNSTWFKVVKITKLSDDNKDEFDVTCFPLQTELNQKKLLNLDEKSQNCSQIMTTILNGTKWAIGQIDPSYNLIYRDFQVTNKTVLEFILNDLVQTFTDSAATFNTDSRTVSIVKEDSVGNDLGLRIKYMHYMSGVNQETNNDTLCTRLYCYGNNGLAISLVNPNGQEYVDDFSYFLSPYQTDVNGNVLISSDYFSDALSKAYINYTNLLNSKTPINVWAGNGTTTTTLIITNHGLSTGDYIKNTIHNEVSSVTVVDANTLTLSSAINGQAAGDSILKYGSNTFGKLLYQLDDLQTTLIQQQNDLDTLQTQKDTILDQLAIQTKANTMDSYISTISNASVTRTLSGLASTDDYVGMCYVSSTPNTTVSLNGTNVTIQPSTWTVLGKMTGSTSYNISVSTTASNVTVKTMIAKILNSEYTTTGNESTIISKYCDDNQQIQINAKQSDINTTNTNITNKQMGITSMQSSLSYPSNFTTNELNELMDYVYEDDYNNENIIDDKDLYDIGKQELAKRNTPQILYKTDIVDFLQSVSEQLNWKKLNLGDTVEVIHPDLGIDTKVKILEIDHNFEQASIQLTIGNNKEVMSKKDRVVKHLYKSLHTSKEYSKKRQFWDVTQTNFDNRNDRISATPNDPVLATDGTAIDHVVNDNGSVDITFEWSYNDYNTTKVDADNIDGFFVYIYSSDKSSRYVIGSTNDNIDIRTMKTTDRYVVLLGVAANKYYTFGVQAYRIVDQDVATNGIIKSNIMQSYVNGENPYQPQANLAYSGDWQGTLNGEAVATVVTNANNGNSAWGKFSGVGSTLPSGNVEFNFANSASKGGNATNTDNVGSQAASTVQNATINFDNRNDRKTTVPAVPIIANDGTAIDHTINTDSSANISFEWSFSGTGDAYDIDGFLVYAYQSTGNTTYSFGTNPASEQVYYVTPDKRAFILYGVPANQYYTFGIESYRIVDQDVNSSGVLKSSIVKPSLASENPYQPSTSISFAGDITGTISGTSASTVVSNAANGNNAWGKFSGAGNTLPSGNVEFNYANSASKGGNATNTDNVGTQAASTVQNATLNFNNRNDRKNTTPADSTIATDGTAVDHTLNTDGSADISLEWGFTGTGDAYDIDGFIIYIYQSTSNAAYTFGSTPASEQVYYVTPEKRAFITYGVAADKFYKFGVQAYRIVDQDINSSGVLKSNIVSPSLASENPYQPSASIAFTGNVTGTVSGTAAATVVTNAGNGQTAYDGTGNYRDTTAPNGTFTCNALTSGTNTDGSIDITLTWSFAQGSVRADGFVVVYESGQNAVPTTASHSYFQDVTSTKMILSGVSANAYHNFKIYAYRSTNAGIVTGALTNGSNWLNYQATTMPNYTGNVGGTPASTVSYNSTTSNINLILNGGAEVYTGKFSNISGNNIPDGWYTYQPSNLCTFTRRVNDASWTISGMASFEISCGSDTVNTYGAYYQDYTKVNAGETYTLSALLEAHRCTTYIRFEYYNASGTLIGSDNGANVIDTTTPTAVTLTKALPANTVKLRVLLWKTVTDTGQTTSYLFADNVKLEKGGQATPYVETDFGTSGAINNGVQQGQSYNSVQINSTDGLKITNSDNTSTTVNGSGVTVNGGNIKIYDQSSNLVMDGRGVNPLESSGWGVTTGFTIGQTSITGKNVAEYTITQTAISGSMQIHLNTTTGLGTSGTFMVYLSSTQYTFSYSSVDTVNNVVNLSAATTVQLNSGVILELYVVNGVTQPNPSATANLTIKAGSCVLKNGVYVKFTSDTSFSLPISVGWGDNDGWEYRVIWINSSGQVSWGSTGTAGSVIDQNNINNYPANPRYNNIGGGSPDANCVILCATLCGYGTGGGFNNYVLMHPDFRDERALKVTTLVTSKPQYYSTDNSVEKSTLATSTASYGDWETSGLNIATGSTYYISTPVGLGKRFAIVSLSSVSTAAGADDNPNYGAVIFTGLYNYYASGTQPKSAIGYNQYFVDRGYTDSNGGYIVHESSLGWTNRRVQDAYLSIGSDGQVYLNVILYQYTGTESRSLRLNWVAF